MGSKGVDDLESVKRVVKLCEVEKYPLQVIAILEDTTLDNVTALLCDANRLKLIKRLFRCQRCSASENKNNRLVFFKKGWVCGKCLNTIDERYLLDVSYYMYRKVNRFKDDT